MGFFLEATCVGAAGAAMGCFELPLFIAAPAATTVEM